MRSLELDRFERARDPSHTRLLPDADIRGFLDANDLVVTTNEIDRERRELGRTSTSSGSRARSASASPAWRRRPEVEIGWYVARKP